MISTLLALAIVVGTAQAQDEGEAPAEEAEAPLEDLLTPTDEADEADEAEEPVEIFDEDPSDQPLEVEQPTTSPLPGDDVLALGYRDGYEQGKSDATMAGNYGLHGLAGFMGGCVVGPCGCVAVPALEAVIEPGVPQGGWQAYGAEYQRGYIDGYRREMQKRRVVYSLAGASLGTVVGVGAGMALGALAF